MKIILKFSSKKTSRNSKKGTDNVDASVHIGLWSVDPIDGGVLENLYPSAKMSSDETLEKISLKIKNLINITVRDMEFKSEWSLSPLTIENYHYYLYGFFLDRWRVISIHLPIDFSLKLIETKSNLLIFESNISNKVGFFSKDQWEENILIPMYEEFITEKEHFFEEKNDDTTT